MNRAWFVVPPLGGRGASDWLKPALRAKTVSGSQYAPNAAWRLSMNRGKTCASRTVSPLTPALSPLRGEGVAAGVIWNSRGAFAALRLRLGGNADPVSLAREPAESPPSPLNGERAGVRGETARIVFE